MHISEDIKKYGVLKFMDIDSILKYCATDKKTREMCNKPDIWKFLLMRDFNIDEASNNVEHLRSKYIYEKYIREFREMDINDIADYLVEKQGKTTWLGVINLYNMLIEIAKENPKLLEQLDKSKNNMIMELMDNNVAPIDVKNWIKNKSTQ